MKALSFLAVLLLIVLAGCSDNGMKKITGAATGIAGECSDSDGIDSAEAGEVVLETGSEVIKRHDLCIDVFLVEYYCEDTQIQTQNFRCVNGCEEGACK